MLEVENGDVMDGDARLPWATGPGEILRHGLELLKKDTDTNRRLAMILIDNAVELMIKTYLGLPRRVTGLAISRGEYQRFSESFPKLLDALEEYADDKLNGIDLGEIEWYHRIRNQLYHQGNGLTVERGKVEVYAELANVLFSNLFGSRLVEPEEDVNALLGDFMLAWIDFERLLFREFYGLLNENHLPPSTNVSTAPAVGQEQIGFMHAFSNLFLHLMYSLRPRAFCL